MQVIAQEAYDQGLRNYMTSIYNWMILGVLISAGVSYEAVALGLPAFFAHHSGWFLLALFTPLLIIFGMASTAQNGPVGTLRVLFVALTAIEGLTLSTVLARFSGVVITEAFLMTAVAFGACSLYGYTTKRTLSGLGTILLMSLIGLIAAMFLNVFFHSKVFDLAICLVGVVVFACFMAYDTQTLKESYTPALTDDQKARLVVWGALDLYLDILNFFLFVLRILGYTSNSND